MSVVKMDAAVMGAPADVAGVVVESESCHVGLGRPPFPDDFARCHGVIDPIPEREAPHHLCATCRRFLERHTAALTTPYLVPHITTDYSDKPRLHCDERLSMGHAATVPAASPAVSP